MRKMDYAHTFLSAIFLLLLLQTFTTAAASEKNSNIQKHADIVRLLTVETAATKPEKTTGNKTLTQRQYDGGQGGEADGEPDYRNQNEITYEQQQPEQQPVRQQQHSQDPYASNEAGSSQYVSVRHPAVAQSQVQYNNDKNPLPLGQQQSQPTNNYGGQSNADGGYRLARPIAQQPTTPFTLSQIYSQSTTNTPYGSTNQPNSQNRRLEMLYSVNYEQNFDQVNPRNNASQWRWSNNQGGLIVPADNAAIFRHPASQYQSSSAYGKSSSSGGGGTGGYIDIISLAFDRSYNLSNPNDPYLEARIVYKNNFTANNMQRIVFRQLYACKIYNADQNPFPSTLVANANDDPRLANCEFRVIDDQNNFFYFSLTNQGVWAIYGHNGLTATDLSFIAKRLVGVRQSYYDLVDAAIEYDGRLNAVNYYLNGYLVWTISMLGAPSPADGVTKIDLGRGTTLANYNRSTTFSVRTGTRKCLDETDPNNPASTIRLVRLQPLTSAYYGPNATFYDNVEMRSNVVWGQGADLRLYKLRVLRAESLAPTFVPVVLPAVYGNSGSGAQQQSSGGYYRNDNSYAF